MKALVTTKRLAISLTFVAVLLVGFTVFIQTDYFDVKPIMSTPPSNALYLDKTQPTDVRVANLLSYMTLEEKIGQMALVEKNSLKEPQDIATYHIGALLSGAGAKPEENTTAGWRAMIEGYQAEAQKSRLGIPLLYGADAIHGHAHVQGVTVFPHAIGLGATNDPELVESVANATAEELFASGVNWSFSPNLDQPRDIRWGRVYEAFSDHTPLVEKLGAAYVKGLQQPDELSANHLYILATPKHYLGLGSMGWNTSTNINFKIDQGVTPADEAQLRAHYLPPFKAAVEAGALSIMVGLNTWGDKRMVFQKELLTDVLKEEVGFKGFLVSDWYGVHEGSRIKFLATVRAINAGVDMVMLPFDYQSFVRHLTWANRLGLVSDDRIDDAAGRVLYAKFALGLFDEERSTLQRANLSDPAHKTLAREAVASSLVLLKNETAVLPLSPTTPHIRVVGSAADNVGRQTGAWTIEWQGIEGNWLPGATSILEGIKTTVSDDTLIEYEPLGNFMDGEEKAPIGIAVVGEKPYAEGWGDTANPVLSNEDLLAIKNLQASAERVVVVIVSGRPLLITDEVESFDALVAAWLPGSEGDGVSDGLFGRTPFTGTLPVPWSRHAEQLPLTTEGATADGTPVLFPRFYGLK